VLFGNKLVNRVDKYMLCSWVSGLSVTCFIMLRISDVFNSFFYVLQKFKTLLIVELSKVFPNEMAKYRQLRGDDRPSSQPDR